MLTSDYGPYTSGETGVAGNCSYEKGQGKVSAGGFEAVVPNDSFQLQAALMLGPVAVSIDASSTMFGAY